MDRRSFLTAAAAGLSFLGLAGCGSGTVGVIGLEGTGPASVAQQVRGRIAPELLFSGAEVGSAYGPSTVSGNTFTTSISGNSVGLLALADGAGGVRGFALTLPGETPVFSAEDSALAIIFLEPGFLRLDPTAAKELIARIRASSAFGAFVQILLSNAQTRRLDLLSGDANYIQAREALVQSLGNPFTALNPTGQVQSKGVGTMINPSPRFLRVVSDDTLAVRWLPPYGTLGGVSTTANYTFHGLGPASTLPDDTFLIESTYFPTLVFALFLPWLELAIGQKIPVELGLAITSGLRAQTLDPRVDLASTNSLATAMAVDSAVTLGDLAESISLSFSELTKLITGGAYLAGLAFTIIAIMKFKQHKDNPTSNPLGTPLSYAFISAVLRMLPSMLGIAGHKIFEDNPQPPSPF